MLHNMHLIDNVPVQDRDLLSRLSQYFDSLETRLREGQGWFIFNAKRERAARITQYIARQMAAFRPLISYYHLTWRDFALQAYMSEVEMVGWEQNQSSPKPSDRIEQEHRIATQVAQGTKYHMLSSDLLVLSGLAPSQAYEVTYLERILSARYEKRMASILITPMMPHELADCFRAAEGPEDYWQQLFDRMYKTSLLAL